MCMYEYLINIIIIVFYELNYKNKDTNNIRTFVPMT